MLFYRIDDFSDALYFTFYHIAVLQILRRHKAHTDTCRRSHGNDRACGNFHGVGQFLNDIGNVVDIQFRVALLPQFPVDFTGEIQLRRKVKAVCRHKAGTHRCKAVQTFAAEPLLMPHLNAPCTDIVHNGVAEHIGSRVLRPGTLNVFPHDECHFHFVVQIGDNVKVSPGATASLTCLAK